MAKVFFFLSREQHLAKILFYLSIVLAIGFVVVSSTGIQLVEEGWGYGNGRQLTGQPAVGADGRSLAAVVINGGNAETAERQVTLTFNMTRVQSVAVSNDISFTERSFIPYQSSMTWTLLPGLGMKTVYVQFLDNTGSVVEAQDTIRLVAVSSIPAPTTSTSTPAPTPSPAPNPAPDQSPSVGQPTSSACALEPGAYREARGRAVFYVTDQCTKRPFSRAQIYFTYFSSWDDVKIVSSATLAKVPVDPLLFMPWGHLRRYQNGDILKTPSDPKVYIIVNGKKNWITSETVFLSLYGSWSMVEDVDPRVLLNFADGVEITDISRHPDGTLVKLADDPKTYLIEDGKLRWVVNEAAFNARNYRWDRIFVVSDVSLYGTGSDITQ